MKPGGYAVSKAFFNAPAATVQECSSCHVPRKVDSYYGRKPVCARCAAILRLVEKFKVQNV